MRVVHAIAVVVLSAAQVPAIPDSILERPIGLRAGIGVPAAAGGAPTAQALYAQGMAFLHSYVWIDAARSFHEALRLDATLASAHIGLSYAYEELNKSAAATAALERARTLHGTRSARDRRHLEIRATQLAGNLAAYRTALDKAVAAAPSDIDLWLLRGMAESGSVADRGQGSTDSSVPFYERALALDRTYFPAHHYLVHAHENAGRIDKALAHAREYVRLAPAIPHAHHMLGHNLRRAGQIRDAIAEFRKAYELETSPARTAEVPPAHDWHHQHNLDLLATSHQYMGQMRAAERLMRTSFEMPTPFVVQAFNKREWPAFLLARGRAGDALSAAQVLARSPAPIVRGIGQVMAGRARLALRDFAAAAEASNAAMKELRAAGPEASLPAPYLQGLQAEFFLHTGNREKAVAMFRDVRRKIRALPGPDAWSQALFQLESIGRAGITAGAWDLAAETAADMQAHDDAYGGTHYLAALVAEHQGDAARMKRHLELAEKAWRDADADFSDAQDVHRRLRRAR